jgi:ABC-type transport system substrate-binding protein
MDMDAVKFSVDRMIAAEPKNGGKATNFPPQVQAIASDEVQPGNKIVLHLSSPVAGALIHTWLKESDHLAIVSPPQVQKLRPGKAFDAHPVGAGPYQFVSFQADQLLQLRTWSGYWDSAERKLGGIDFVQTKAGAPAVAALLAGTIDQADLGPADAASVEGRPEIQVNSQPTDGMLMMPVCLTKAPFNTIAARQALQYAINRADIGKAAVGKYAAVTDSPLSTTNPYYTKPGSDVAYNYDTAKAKQLLAQAGVASGTNVSLFVASPAAGIGPASEVVQQELAAVGLNVSIVTGSSDFITNIGRLKPNLAILNNKLSALQNWTMPGGPAAAWCQYANPDLITAAAGADSANSQKAAAAWKTEQQIYRSEIPIVFIGSQPGLTGHSPKVHGITAIHSQGAGPLFRTIYMSK